MNAKERMLQMIGNNSIKCAEVFDQAQLLVRLQYDYSKQQEEIFFDVLRDYEDDDLNLSATVTLKSGDWIEVMYMLDSKGEEFSSWIYNKVPKKIFINSVFSVSFSGRNGELKKVEVFSTLAMANSYIGMLIRDHKLITECISGTESLTDEYHRFEGGEVIILTEHKI